MTEARPTGGTRCVSYRPPESRHHRPPESRGHRSPESRHKRSPESRGHRSPDPKTRGTDHTFASRLTDSTLWILSSPPPLQPTNCADGHVDTPHLPCTWNPTIPDRPPRSHHRGYSRCQLSLWRQSQVGAGCRRSTRRPPPAHSDARRERWTCSSVGDRCGAADPRAVGRGIRTNDARGTSFHGRHDCDAAATRESADVCDLDKRVLRMETATSAPQPLRILPPTPSAVHVERRGRVE